MKDLLSRADYFLRYTDLSIRGSRKLEAVRLLGINKTTPWRKMKR